MTDPGLTQVTGGPEDALARLDQWAAGLTAKAGKYATVAEQTSQLRLTATSTAGFVRVTVRADGTVAGLEFSPKARSVPMPELASLILDTMRRAQAGIAERVGEVLATQLGDEDPRTRELMLADLRGRFPDPDDDEPGEPEPPASAGPRDVELPEGEHGRNEPW